MQEPVITEWNDEQRGEFRKSVVSARHRLHRDEAFSDDALAELIDRHPRELCDFCTMGDDPTDRESWRAGDPGELDGHSLLEAVKAGKLWINLREAMSVDPIYAPLHKRLFSQLKALNPGYDPLRTYGGILISSPKAQVFYHADVSETLLLHVRGHKRIRIYPPHQPWLKAQSMESILHHRQTEDMPFQTSWDGDAATFDLKPGDMVAWPLHAPHRVENIDGLNVSITCEVVTQDSLLKNAVLHANGALRQMGWVPRSTSTQGPQVYTKLLISKVWKFWAKYMVTQIKVMPKSERTFDIDPNQLEGFKNRELA